MRRLLIAILASVLSLSLVTAITARTPARAATTPPPVQGNKPLSVVMYVDTIQGAGGTPAPAVGCSQTNLFRQGQVVVFRMWGVNVKLGGVALTPKNVQSAVVKIPGVKDLKLTYGPHGKAPNPVVSFWSAPWFGTAMYPLGVVHFAIVLKTKADKKHHLKVMTARYTQDGFAPTSQLTITP